MEFALGAGARAAGYGLIAYDTVGSTNAEALSLAREGRGPVWVAARAQTAGRGRRGRMWATARGNLAASVGLVTTGPASRAATLGFVAGLALEAALRAVAPAIGEIDGGPKLKWPNDVLLGGAKLSGILLEAETAAGGRLAVAVGIGVNVVAVPAGLPYPATSLAALGASVDAETLFAALSDAFAGWFNRWDEGRGLPEIRKAWMARAAGIGAPVAVELAGRTLRGLFETIDEDGRLVIRAADGAATAIAAGDVHFGAAATAPAQG